MRSLGELNRRRGVVIDTMVFLYLFEAHPAHADLCEALVGRMAQGCFSGVVTPIAAAEILVKPLMQNRPSMADRCRAAIRSLPNAVLATIDEEIAFMAGALN